MWTLLAKLVLTNIERVKPEVLVKLKARLTWFNARKKRWDDGHEKPFSVN